MRPVEHWDVFLVLGEMRKGGEGLTALEQAPQLSSSWVRSTHVSPQSVFPALHVMGVIVTVEVMTTVGV